MSLVSCLNISGYKENLPVLVIKMEKKVFVLLTYLSVLGPQRDN